MEFKLSTVAKIRLGIYGFTWIFGLGANFLGKVKKELVEKIF